MRLSNFVYRCVGRRVMGDPSTDCEIKRSCARYMATVNGEFGCGLIDNHLCKDGQDSFIEYMGEASKGCG